MEARRDTSYGVCSGILPILPFVLLSAGVTPASVGPPHLPWLLERPGAAASIAPELAPLADQLVAGAARDLALGRLAGYGPLLRFLPLEELDSVHPDVDGIELVFDFGERSTRRVELPGRERWVIDPRAGRDPLAEGRPKRVRGEDRTLIVHRRVRFRWDESGITGVAEGDLEIAYGPFAPNVSVSTERRAGEARDEKGRIVLQVDERGEPLWADGRWVPLRAERWVVLEVKGRRFELPLAE